VKHFIVEASQTRMRCFNESTQGGIVKGFVLRNLTPPLFVPIRLLWMQQKSPETEIQAAELLPNIMFLPHTSTRS